jgi:hypothetical protein
MARIRLVQGDTKPRLNFTVKQDGVVVDITGATVRFKFRKFGSSSNIFSRSCTIVNGALGTCYVDFQAGDLVDSGIHVGEIEVTYADSSIQSSKTLIEFDVREQL